eukprot:1017631-Pyramimonas_sp.AAC.1
MASKSKWNGRCPKLNESTHGASRPTHGHSGTSAGTSSMVKGIPTSCPFMVKNTFRETSD